MLMWVLMGEAIYFFYYSNIESKINNNDKPPPLSTPSIKECKSQERGQYRELWVCVWAESVKYIHTALIFMVHYIFIDPKCSQVMIICSSATGKINSCA